MEKNGMEIRIAGKSIQFDAGDKVFYKNLESFLKGLSRGQRIFYAPLSEEITKELN